MGGLRGPLPAGGGGVQWFGPGAAHQAGRAGLAEVLPDVFLSGEVGASKPDARIFEAALAHVGRPPEEVLHVGDDPERDVMGAARLGLATCWVSHGRPWPSALPPPTFTVACIPSRLEDIAGVLTRWT
ncbi:HAD family hydrolase [Myxococcus sp. 1LA]